MPPAHAIASRMSESKPPHLPSARTGKIQGLHVLPATPSLLFVSAPTIPATRVPCHELFLTSQPANRPWFDSCCEPQSPASDASASRPSPSLAAAAFVMKS